MNRRRFCLQKGGSLSTCDDDDDDDDDDGSGKSGPKDQVALHYYYTSPSHWCTTHEVSKL